MKRGATLLITLLCAALAQRWLDAQPRPALADDEALYLRSGERLRAASLGFGSLLADLYWVRTCIYFGGKLQEQSRSDLVLGLHQMPQLEPLLRITTELDPHYTAAYRFGAFFLPALGAERALEFVQAGIQNNPDDWRLYQDLAMVYWAQRRFAEASEAYLHGSRLPGAPAWMAAMAATMAERGGDPALAGEIFARLCQNTDDQFIQQLCAERAVAQSKHQTPNTKHQ